MKVSIIDVSPEQAAAWLKSNTRNRNLNARLVADYARQMADGRWHLNGEAVKISEDGVLLDGQHRLAAIVASGFSIEMLVVEGLPSETQDTMDSGRKRTVADVFSINGEGNANVLASVARRAWMWDRGNHKFSNLGSPSAGELSETLERYPSLRRSAEIGVRINSSFRPASATVTGTAHHILTMVSEGDAAEFFARLETGASLKSGHPVLTLRERLVRDRLGVKKVPFHLGVALYVRAWNAVREDRDLMKIQHTAEEPMVLPV